MKFSVCIPNFNYEAYIGQTIQSVLDQTYDNFEIFIDSLNKIYCLDHIDFNNFR